MNFILCTGLGTVEEDLTVCPENDTCSIDVMLHDVETGDVIMNLTFCSSALEYDSCAEDIVRKQPTPYPFCALIYVVLFFRSSSKPKVTL